MFVIKENFSLSVKNEVVLSSFEKREFVLDI